MKKLLSFLFSLVLVFTLTSSKKECTIFIIGDSTAANKELPKSGQERGWGMVFQGCFTENIHVDNHAQNGRSTTSFIRENRWQKVLDLMKPGDYVIIQFGHNDEKHDVEGRGKRFAKPGGTFDANLEKFVTEARAKGGIPILMNCVERRLFYDKRFAKNDSTKAKDVDDESLRGGKVDIKNDKINTDYLVPTHYTEDGDYAAAPYLVAKKLNVPFVDANRITHWIEQEHGAVGSRDLHMIKYNGRDNTHYNVYGAHVVANRLADALGEAVPELKPFIRHYDYVVSAKGRGNYMTLQEAVDAVPAGTETTVLVLDGTWQKPSIPANKKIKIEKYSTVTIQ